MLSCIIVDDEQHCIDALAGIINKKFSDALTIVGSSRDGQQVPALINKLSPDIIFLDVEMPAYSGLQVLSHFPERNFCVVFTTAFDKYALQAFKTEATDYLLKPISLPELQTAIEKCERELKDKYHKQKSDKKDIKKLLLPTGKGLLFADVKDIIRIESNNNYSIFTFSSKPKLTVARTLKEFDEQLSEAGFFRVHHSHLINLLYVESFESGDADYIILTNGDKIELARRRKADFMRRLAAF